MNNFEELQNKWKSQSGLSATENGFESILKSIKLIEKQQKIGNVVLSATIIVLVGFLMYVSGYKNSTFLLGIGLMIGSLVLRIMIELFSIHRLKHIDFKKDANSFKVDITKYYQSRKKVHFLITPLSVIIYVIGFILLLPLFKASLSHGFYLYILFSSVIFLIIFSVFISKQIKRELLKLKRLQE